jgi:ComEC/Rec2-related protein
LPGVSLGHLRAALMSMGLAVAAGCGLIWAKSAMVGTPAIVQPMTPRITARVMDRYAQPAEHRLRLELAFAEPGSGRPILARLSMPEGRDQPGLTEGAVVQLRARLMPPAAPMLPGGYDAARAAWFDGVAATGTVLGPVRVISPAPGDSWLARMRHALADHVRSRVAGPAGGIAAAFASGDRGGIPASDEQAMRDSGLTHLLSVSGLHVSAVIAGVYMLAIRLLALFPWLALRVRLPLLASAFGGAAGIFYTLLTGAQVPTVRSVLGALLVLAALALGRQPFTVRLLAVAAICTMLLWPEAVIGPSFQMSFGSVLALVVLHDCAPVRAFLAPREEGWWRASGASSGDDPAGGHGDRSGADAGGAVLFPPRRGLWLDGQSGGHSADHLCVDARDCFGAGAGSGGGACVVGLRAIAGPAAGHRALDGGAARLGDGDARDGRMALWAVCRRHAVAGAVAWAGEAVGAGACAGGHCLAGVAAAARCADLGRWQEHRHHRHCGPRAGDPARWAR